MFSHGSDLAHQKPMRSHILHWLRVGRHAGYYEWKNQSSRSPVGMLFEHKALALLEQQKKAALPRLILPRQRGLRRPRMRYFCRMSRLASADAVFSAVTAGSLPSRARSSVLRNMARMAG